MMRDMCIQDLLAVTRGESCQWEWMPPVPDTRVKANTLGQIEKVQ